MYKNDEQVFFMDQTLITIQQVETKLQHSLPNEYKEFLSNFDLLSKEELGFPITLRDGYKMSNVLRFFFEASTFLNQNDFRSFLEEYIEPFELTSDYVEPQYLYFIAECLTGNIAMAIGGQHEGKLYYVDNGDFGIIYLSSSIKDFMNTLYEVDGFACDEEDILKAVSAKDLTQLKILLEQKDGDKIIQLDSWLDIKLFDLAYEANDIQILTYLVGKGFTGFNRLEHYKSMIFGAASSDQRSSD